MKIYTTYKEFMNESLNSQDSIDKYFISKELVKYLNDIEVKYPTDTYEWFIEQEPDTGRTGPRVVVTITLKDGIEEEEEFYYNSTEDALHDVRQANMYFEFS
jgi:hypothetical protein